MNAGAKVWTDEPCRRCDQTGIVYRRVEHLGRVCWQADDCADCGGTGRILAGEVAEP